MKINDQVMKLHGQGKYREATVIAEQALQVSVKVFGPENSTTALCRNNLEVLYDSQANYAAAEPLCQRALQIWDKLLGPEHHYTLIGLSDLAELYRN